jgi:hypothetical protein
VNNSSSYFQKAIPGRFTLLGLDVLPLSLGHIVILNHIESPFVTGKIADLDDLALAVLICSLDFEKGCEAIADPELPKFLKQWSRQLTGMSGLRRWLVKLRILKPFDVNWVQKIELFTKYLSAAMDLPAFQFEESETARVVECPFVQIVKVKLMSELHISEADILDRSWNRCLWDYVTLKVFAGDMEFVDEDEMADMQKQADEFDRKFRESVKN